MEPVIILMYSDKHQDDMWWIETEDKYIGPFESRSEAVKEMVTKYE